MYYVNDGLVIHDKGGAWGWYRLDTWRSELLSYDQLVDQVGRDARRYVALTGMDCHQIGVPQHYDVEGWLRRLTENTPNPSAGFEELKDMQRGRVRDADSSRRVVYLGCKLEEPRRDGLWETLGVSEIFRKTDKLLGAENPRPSEKALRELRHRRDAVRKKVLTGYRTAELASSGELRRLLMRSLWRGLIDLPEPEARETWGGEARALFEGAVIENRHRWLRIERPGHGEFYMAVVGFHRFPDELEMPGGEWLAKYQELPFAGDIEYSVRYRVLSHREASTAVGKTVKAVLDQRNHILEAGDRDRTVRVPPSLTEKVEVAEDLDYRVKSQREPLVDAWPRLVVTAPDEEEMEARLEAISAWYHDELDVGVLAPTGDQLGLLKETTPGMPFYLRRTYPQQMSVDTLAGAGALTSTSLGDGVGPYMAQAEVGGDHVHFDPHFASRINKPTLIYLAGRLGCGKSNQAYLIVYLNFPRGFTIVLTDPKEEANGLIKLCQPLGQVNKIRMDETSIGMLDPFRIVTHDKKEAGELAATMLRAMLPQRTVEDIEVVINTAASQAANLAHPSMMDVVDKLAEFGGTWGQVSAAAGGLRAVAETPLGKVCFSTGETLDLNAFRALTVLQFKSLPLPEESIDPLRYTQPNRTATAIVTGMSALANRLIDVGQPEDPKLLVYDEARHMLSNPEGRASLERFTLQGRSKGITPMVLSQNASHMIGETLVSNVGTVFIYELPSEREATSGCALAGIEPSEENVKRIQTLAPNPLDGSRPDYARCIMRDVFGRSGVIQPDLQTEEIRNAFDTTPGHRFALQEAASA